MEISTRNKQQMEVNRLDRAASGLSAPAKTTPKVREFRTVRSEQVRQEQQIKQQTAVQQQKSGLQSIVSRVSNLFKNSNIARFGGRQVAEEVTKEEMLEYKSIEQRMAERGPDKREIALQKHRESLTQQGVLREQLRATQVNSPAGYLEALEAELESLEEGEKDEFEDSIVRARKLTKVSPSVRLKMKDRRAGEVLLKSSILLGLLPKAIERWLDLVSQGKKPGPTLREMKQLSRN